jgi:hypothetical protein
MLSLSSLVIHWKLIFKSSTICANCCKILTCYRCLFCCLTDNLLILSNRFHYSNSPTSSYDVGSKIQDHLPWSQAYYGKDNNGTLFDDEAMFNLDRLDTRLSRDWTRNGELRKERIEKDTKRKMNTKSGDNIRKKLSEDETGDGEGLIRSYLYLGSFGSSFCGMIHN